MANTHEVTVFIWRNGPLVGRQVQAPQGHAALKIQDPGTGKGDYHYLSFYPSAQGVELRTHRMAGRLGPGSMAAAEEQADGKKFFETTDFSISDMIIQGKKPDIKYRFRGMNFVAMLDVIRGMMPNLEQNKPAARFILHTNNCSNAVANCLKAGVGPLVANSATFTQVVFPPAWLPNDIEAVCERLHQAGTYQSAKI